MTFVSINAFSPSGSWARADWKKKQQTIKTTVQNVESLFSWRKGYYEFSQEKLPLVLDKLTRYYNVGFVMNKKVGQNETYSGAFKLNDDLDKVVKTLFTPAVSIREHPDHEIENGQLSVAQKKHVLGLMRINHCGEICAQGLYQGQALTARNKSNGESFRHAALEETEHLAWVQSRIHELGGKTSILNPLFYAGSFFVFSSQSPRPV